MTGTGWTSDQVAFQRLARQRWSQVHAVYPEAIGFRLVRINGSPVGWTFHTGNYPRSDFGWVSLAGRVGTAQHELRLTARRHLKESVATQETERKET